MYSVIISFILILAILLILIILAQNPKGGGLSSQFGGSASTQFMGVKKTSDLLEKLTWSFALGLMLLSIITNFSIPTEIEENLTSPNVQDTQQNTLVPPTNNDEFDGLKLDENLLIPDSTQ